MFESFALNCLKCFAVDKRVLGFLSRGFDRFEKCVRTVLSSGSDEQMTEEKQYILTWLHTIMLGLREGHGDMAIVQVAASYMDSLLQIISIEHEEIPAVARVILGK